MPAVRSVFARTPIALAVVALFPATFVRTPKPTKVEPAYILAADPGDEPEVKSVPIAQSARVRGRARVAVRAPIERVRQVVLDFAHYPEFMPHYEACRVLGPTKDGGRDVYMRVAAIHGAVKMWARVEVSKAHDEGGAEVIATRFVEGNVKTLETTFRLKALDGQQTMLEFELFLDPKLPLPDLLVNRQNLEGARAAVLAYKARSEGRAPPTE